MSNSNSVQFLFVTVPTTEGGTAVFNALDVVKIIANKGGAVIFFRNEAVPLDTTLSPAEVAAATEEALTGLLDRMLMAVARSARKAGF